MPGRNPALDATPGHPVTYRPGSRISALFNGRRYVGTVTESGHASTFEVIWDGDRGRGRFVHGSEPAALRFATAHDVDDATGAAQRLAAAWVLRELVATHPDWPQHVLDALRLKAHNLAGPTTQRSENT